MIKVDKISEMTVLNFKNIAQTLHSRFSIVLAAGIKSTFVLAAIYPQLALGAGSGAEQHHPGISSLFWPLMNFLVFAGIFFWIHRKVTGPMLVERAVTFSDRLKKSSQLLEQAQWEKSKVALRLQDIEQEKEELLLRLTRDGANLAVAVAETAEKSGAKMLEDVERRIASELATAQADVRASVVAKASQLAKEQLRASLGEQDDLRLRKDAIRSLG